MTTGSTTVLILGAGINGCALARELLLNGVSVWLVDTRRHRLGGDRRLVAPDPRRPALPGIRRVRPGQGIAGRADAAAAAGAAIRAPAASCGFRPSNRFGGCGRRGRPILRLALVAHAAAQGRPRRVADSRRPGALRRLCPRPAAAEASASRSVADAGTPPVDRHKYRWLCSYYDAQVDVSRAARRGPVGRRASNRRTSRVSIFACCTYHAGRRCTATRSRFAPIRRGHSTPAKPRSSRPLIVNATGAWVDETLERLHVPSRRLDGRHQGQPPVHVQPAAARAAAAARASMPRPATAGRSSSRRWPIRC